MRIYLKSCRAKQSFSLNEIEIKRRHHDMGKCIHNLGKSLQTLASAGFRKSEEPYYSTWTVYIHNHFPFMGFRVEKLIKSR